MILASLLLAFQAPATGSADALAFDVRCLILSSGLRENDDPNLRQAAEVMSNYFFGRVDGRAPDADLAALITAEMAAMADADPQAAIQACGRELEERGRRMVEAGARIEARERAAGGPAR